MNEEPITAKLFLSGLVKPKTAVKSAAYGLWIALFVLAGFTIYRAFFMKINQQQIIARKGSNVSVTQINKPSRFFIPFIETGIGKSSPISI